jgi:hypothetical protein
MNKKSTIFCQMKEEMGLIFIPLGARAFFHKQKSVLAKGGQPF